MEDKEHNEKPMTEKVETPLETVPEPTDKTEQEEEEKKVQKIPMLNVFPKDSPPPLFAFTDEDERRKRSEGPYVLEPEHREVFRIKTKRDVKLGKPKEISDATYLNRDSKVNSIFDIMDIMSAMQKTLFGTMLQEESGQYYRE